jgi:hypothetical protein
MNIEKEFKNLLSKLEIVQNDPYEKINEAIDLQINILTSLIKIEKKIKSNKEIIILNKQSIKNSDKKEYKIEKNNENNRIKEESDFLKNQLKRFREIGDSIAFLYFDKHDLKSLCWKQDAGYLSGKVGLKKELEIFQEYILQGTFCILNDITNSLRFGDITIDIEGKPQLIEVKTGIYDNQRVIRQANNLAERNKLLENDVVENFPEQNITLIKIDIPEKEKNYIQEFQDALSKIKSGEEYCITPEEGIWYFFNYKSTDYRQFDQIRKTCKKATVFFLNQYKNCDENYLPFPLVFNNSFYLNEFYNGELLIIVLIDFSVFLEKLSKHNIFLEFEDDIYYHFSFLNKGKKDNINMSKLAFNRIGREFESIDWTIASLCGAIKKATHKNT